MSTEYRNNHYVPQWYQKRFIPDGQVGNELYCLDLKPGTFTDPRGIVHNKRALKKQGYGFVLPKTIYTQDGLATLDTPR